MPISTLEQIAPADFETLPTGDALREHYAFEFSAIDLPTTFRMAQAGEHEDVAIPPDIPLSHTPEDIRFLQNEFLKQAPGDVYNNSWWIKANRLLTQVTKDLESIQDIPVIAKHRLDIVAGGEQTGQGYDVLEMGEPEDPAAVEVVLDTLKLIDQSSGGLLSAQRSGTRVALLKGVTMSGTDHGGKEAGGFAVEGAVVINTDGVRRWEGVTDDNFHQVLAAVTVHEVLGHGMERAVKGRTGVYYDEHFQYRDYKPGKLFKSVATSVVAKDPTVTDPSPVREYGRVNHSEGFAAATDATVAHAMGWSEEVNKVPRLRSTTNTHHRDLVLGLMDEAARMAKVYDHTPGFAGSELSYTFDANGNVTGIEPVRTMEVKTLYGKEAVQDEIRRTVDTYTPREQLVVGPGEWL